jgi:hypothetical protein
LEERVAERTAERNMLATLVETTDVMIMAADRDYNILATNAANADEFERIFGVRPKLGTTCSSCSPASRSTRSRFGRVGTRAARRARHLCRGLR